MSTKRKLDLTPVKDDSADKRHKPIIDEEYVAVSRDGTRIQIGHAIWQMRYLVCCDIEFNRLGREKYGNKIKPWNIFFQYDSRYIKICFSSKNQRDRVYHKIQDILMNRESETNN